MPIVPLDSKPTQVYQVSPILTFVSTGYLLEWRPQGLLIASPDGNNYHKVSESQISQLCCAVSTHLFCHPNLLLPRHHFSCSQELFLGLTSNETDLSCYDSFMLCDVNQAHVTKYQDKRFYGYDQNTQTISVSCQGRPRPHHLDLRGQRRVNTLPMQKPSWQTPSPAVVAQIPATRPYLDHSSLLGRNSICETFNPPPYCPLSLSSKRNTYNTGGRPLDETMGQHPATARHPP